MEDVSSDSFSALTGSKREDEKEKKQTWITSTSHTVGCVLWAYQGLL